MGICIVLSIFKKYIHAINSIEHTFLHAYMVLSSLTVLFQTLKVFYNAIDSSEILL